MPSSPRTIVHLITSLGGGGTENFLFQILSRTPPGYRHHVYYLGKDGVNGDRIRGLGVSVDRIASLYGFYRLLKENPPWLLHTCLYWGHQVGRVVGRMARVRRIVSSQQSIDVWQKPWHGWIDRWTLPLCDVVDVNSTAAQRVLEKRLKGATKTPRFVKVENGVDFALFKPQSQAESRRALTIPSDALIGGTLMRLHAEKGAEKIPAFARQLLAANPGLYLVIGGTGPLEDQLKDQTRDLGDRLRWLGWQNDTVRFLSALDFFWLLSREESFPQALLEASAMGLPWLAPDVGGIHELIEAGTSGATAPAGDMAKICAFGNDLIQDLSPRTAKARAAIPRLSQRYSIEIMSQAFYRIAEENDL